MANTSEAIEALAADIGENIYIDVAKWHLYLADAHLHTEVAERVYPLLEEDGVSQAAVQKILSEISVQLGGGTVELPLANLIPSNGLMRLLELLEDARDRL